MALSSNSEIQQFVTRCIDSNDDPSSLLQHLIAIQAAFQFVPPEAVSLLQQKLQISMAEINAVISFYSFLNNQYEGDYRILFSDNITDRFNGNRELFQQLAEALKDEQVSLGFTSCSGLCDQGPGLLVNGRAINRLTNKRIDEIAQLVRRKIPVVQWPDHLFDIQDNIQRRDQQLSIRAGNGDAIQTALQMGKTKTLDLLDDSGLRGRGGAGFSTAQKWQFCAQTDSDQHFVVCNADEGEPGTFKDRVLLNSSAHSVFEGMTVCAAVIGANKGFVYLRGEYLFLLEHLQEVLEQRRQNALLGKDILGHQGFDFDIEIHLGAGAYICGEESALIESLEGKRGQPRIRPPFPVTQGYKGQPTVVNNVETFWSVSRILQKGSAWFKSSGTDLSSGTRLLSISGDCERPGIYEFPFGVSLNTILQECGGSDAQAVQMAGAAGNLVLPEQFDRCMSFEDLATGGSFMVIGPQRNLLEVLDNFAEFFRHESCGFCTPCRVGTSLVADLMKRFTQRQASEQDRSQLKEITLLMAETSFCGLGHSAPNAFLNALDQCPELFDNSISSADQNPVFNLDEALSEFRHITQQKS